MDDYIEVKPKPKGHVRNVCKEILIREDENLAYKLQNQEFHTHFDFNRKERSSIRAALPVARTLQNKEYQEQLRRHQLLEQREREDALIAEQEQKRILEELNNQIKLQQLADEQYARTLERSMSPKVKYVSDANSNGIDEFSSNRYNNKEYLKKLQEKDSQIAKYLQEQEKRKIQSSPLFIDEDEKLARKLQAEEDLRIQKERSNIKLRQNQLNNTEANNRSALNTHYNRCQTIHGAFLIDQNYLDSSSASANTSTNRTSTTINRINNNNGLKNRLNKTVSLPYKN